MGIMDHTYFIRSLREKEFKDIVELSSRTDECGYLSEEILSEYLKDNVNCSFTLSFSAGDGKKKVIGFHIVKVEDHNAYIKFSALDKEFSNMGVGFSEMLKDHVCSEVARKGKEFVTNV